MPTANAVPRLLFARPARGHVTRLWRDSKLRSRDGCAFPVPQFQKWLANFLRISDICLSCGARRPQVGQSTSYAATEDKLRALPVRARRTAGRRAQSDVEHDVERAGESARLHLVGVLQAHDDAFARLAVSDGIEHGVAGIARFAGDVELRGETPDARRVHLEVDVRRASGMGDRADGAEGVAAAGVDTGAAIALESRIASPATGVAGVIVDAVGVALPDLDHGTGHRLPATVQDAAGDVRDAADGLRFLSHHADEVGIHVGRERGGVERAFG